MTVGRFAIYDFDKYSTSDQLNADGYSVGDWNGGLTVSSLLQWHTKYYSSHGPWDNCFYVPNDNVSAATIRVQSWFVLISSPAFCFADSALAEQFHVRIAPAYNTMYVWRGSTLLASQYVSTLVSNSVHCIEIYATASITSGKIIITLDGNLLTTLNSSLVSVNNCNTGVASFNRYGESGNGTFEIAIDYAATEDWTFSKARLGTGTFGTLNSNSGTVNGSLTALGVLNTAARDTTDYIEWTAAGSINATPTALSAVVDIYCVQLGPCLTTNNSGVVTANQTMSDGTNTITYGTIYPAASYTGTFPLNSTVAPDGSAWDIAHYNALQAIVSRTA